MSFETARQLLYVEKDGEFPDHMMHIGGSCALVTINGTLSIITARHCISSYMAKYSGSPKHCIATMRTVGEADKFALFKNIYFVENKPSRGNVIGEECDLAILKSLPGESYQSPDAWPLIDGPKVGNDPSLSIGDRILCYGFPDLTGSTLINKVIKYNPCRVDVTVTGFANGDMIAIGVINHIVDYSGHAYPNDSRLNGLSGGPAFRPVGAHGECLSGIVVSAGGGILRFLTSKYIAGFARKHCV